MSKYTFLTGIDQDRYDQFVSTHPNSNLLQSYNWAKIKSNWDHIHTGVEDENGNLVGAALVLIKNLPGGFTFLYIPRGPILDYRNEELLNFYLNALREEAKKHKGLFIKFDPAIHVADYPTSEPTKEKYPETEEILESIKKAGGIHQGFTIMIEEAIQPRFQSVVYKDTFDEAKLPKHTRQSIKTAKKRNIKVKSGHKELLDDFAYLSSLTEERKGIALRDKGYFEHLLDTYGEDAVLFVAYCNVSELYKEAKQRYDNLTETIANTSPTAEKKLNTRKQQQAGAKREMELFESMLKDGIGEGEVPCAGGLAVKYGNTCEMLYAGMDIRFRKFMPQYEEYLTSFKWAFDHDCEICNMGGVEGTLDDGLTEFKGNFGGIINEFIGEFDIPVNKLLYKPARMAYDRVKGSLR